MANMIFTRGLGIFFLVLGICGFTPLARPVSPVNQPHVGFHFTYLFGALPFNYPLAGLFVLIGIGGVIASTTVTRSRIFERILFGLSLVLMSVGFTPGGFSSLWGFMPLFGFMSGFFLFTMFFTFYFAFVEGPLMPWINRPIHLPEHLR